MAFVEIVPPTVSAVYEKMPVRVWSAAGLYAWAQAHAAATTGINIVNSSDLRISTPTQSGGLACSPIRLQEATGRSFLLIGGEIKTTPNRTYAVLFNRVDISKSSQDKGFSGGYISAVADWIEGNSLRTQDQDSAGGRTFEWQIKRNPVHSGGLSIIESPEIGIISLGAAATGINGWAAGVNGLRVYVNTRHLLGAQQGWTFEGSFNPEGAGFLISELSNLTRKQSYEFLFTTAASKTAEEQVLFGLPDSGAANGWEMRAFVTEGVLYVRIQNTALTVGALNPSTTYHAVITCNTVSGVVAVYLNGRRVVYNTSLVATIGGVDQVIIGISAPRLDAQKPPFYQWKGIIHHFRIFNKALSETKALELWNNGAPWNYVLPWADSARPASLVGSAHAYGCCAEFLPQNYIAGDAMTSSVTKGDSTRAIAYRILYNGEIRSPVPSYYNLETKIAHAGVQSPQVFYASELMMYGYAGTALPYRPSPTDIIAIYNYEDTSIPEIGVIVNTAAGSKNITLERHVMPSGYAEFDLSGILKRAFYDARKPIGTYLSRDFLLQNEYVLRIGLERYPTKYYIRQVQQSGFRHDLRSEVASLLLTMPLRRYEGYPLDLVVFNPIPGHTIWVYAYYRPKATIEETFQEVESVLSLSAAMASTVVMIQLAQLGILYSYPIALECTPEKPFYIRWLNALGGWDYKMFGECKYIEDTVTDLVNIQLPERDEYSTQETISLSAYQYVRVGATQLPEDEFDALRKLGRSPRIQHWNEAAQNWFTVVLQKEVTIKSESDTPTGAVEYTFQMPRIRVQF